MKVIAFDLDDTLFYEWRFVASAAVFISKYLEERFSRSFQEEKREMVKAVLNGRRHFDVLEKMLEEKGILRLMSMKDIVSLCRNHYPKLKAAPGAHSLLERIVERGDALFLITDGRSVTQRNKITSLGLDKIFRKENIFISEETGYMKSTGYPFAEIMKRYPGADEYIYIGDNFDKDVEAPQRLGWKSIIVSDRGYNIHGTPVEVKFEPDFRVKSLKEISQILYCCK